MSEPSILMLPPGQRPERDGIFVVNQGEDGRRVVQRWTGISGHVEYSLMGHDDGLSEQQALLEDWDFIAEIRLG